jgi:hypothetical protein
MGRAVDPRIHTTDPWFYPYPRPGSSYQHPQYNQYASPYEQHSLEYDQAPQYDQAPRYDQYPFGYEHRGPFASVYADGSADVAFPTERVVNDVCSMIVHSSLG